MRVRIGALVLVLGLLVCGTMSAQTTTTPPKSLNQSYSGATGTNSGLFGSLLGTNWFGTGFQSSPYRMSTGGPVTGSVPNPGNTAEYLKAFGYQRPWYKR